MTDSSTDATADQVVDNTVVESQTDVNGTQGSNTADSPTTERAGTMLDAVQAALQPKEATPASQTPDQADKADPDAKTAEDDQSDEMSEEEIKAQHRKVQRRFKKLTSALNAKDAELGALKPKADQLEKITTRLSQAGFSPTDIDHWVEIGSLVGGDPRAALQRLIPVVQHLQQLAGEVVPADLEERVRLGYLSEEDARALARAKADATLASRRAEQATQQSAAQAEQARAEKALGDAVGAVEAWDKSKAAKDPDWHLKKELVAEQITMAVQAEVLKRGGPWLPTPEESVKLAEDGLKKVNERLKQFGRPMPVEIKPVTGTTSSRSKPVPKTMLEAVNNALG